MILLGIAGFSGAGKTTLIERLLPCLLARGLVVSVLKHSHHDFDVDRPGKDSWRHRQAGAQEVLVVGGRRWVLMQECRGDETTVAELVARMTPCDLVLVEGYKSVPLPKIEVVRQGEARPRLFPVDASIVAVAADVPMDGPLPCLDVNDAAAVADWIVTWRAGQA